MLWLREAVSNYPAWVFLGPRRTAAGRLAGQSLREVTFWLEMLISAWVLAVHTKESWLGRDAHTKYLKVGATLHLKFVGVEGWKAKC